MKYHYIFLLALFPLFGLSQPLLDKFKNMEEVSSVVVDQNMFSLLSKIEVDPDDPQTKEFMAMARSLKSLTVLITANSNIERDIKSSIDQYLKSSGMEELMQVEDKGSLAAFYTKPGKDEHHVSELLMWGTGLQRGADSTKDKEAIVLSLTGDIDLRKIGTLAQKMNLPQVVGRAGQK